MGSRAILGRVIDERGMPIPELVIAAQGYYIRRLYQQSLGRTVTDNNGEYSLQHTPSRLMELLGLSPEVTVVVLDRVGIREIARASKSDSSRDVTLHIPDIIVLRISTEGWTASLGGFAPSRLSENNDTEVLIDGIAAFASMVEAVKSAQHTVHLTQLTFSPDFTVMFSGGEQPGVAVRPGGVFAQTLLETSRRGVKVRILLNENTIIPDTVDEVRDFFMNTGSNDVSVRPFPLGKQTLHAKVLVIDSRIDSKAQAFIIGSPFEQSYVDTPDHLIDDPRRGKGVPGIGSKPIHDVFIRLRGPAVAHVEEFFIELWNLRSREEFDGEDIIPPPVPPKAAGTQSIQVMRSLPAGVLPGIPAGEAGILEAYQRAISNAQSFIYLENQYFTSQTICDALRQALRMRPDIQIVMLINENMDIVSYKTLQNQLLGQIDLTHPRVGVFSLWKTEHSDGEIKIKPCYIHSKTAVIDDRWGTVGTANLDGISLEAFADVIKRKKPSRNIEINAALLDGISCQPATGNVEKMRRALWAEHLGLESAELIPMPPGGWLELWRRTASENIERLNNNQIMAGKVLPYSPAVSPKEQLKSVGIDVGRLHVL